MRYFFLSEISLLQHFLGLTIHLHFVSNNMVIDKTGSFVLDSATPVGGTNMNFYWFILE